MKPSLPRSIQRWREQWNPLRALTMVRALDLLDQAQRGEHAEVQWAYRLMERRFAPLGALIERRIGALLEMEWEVELVDADRANASVRLAEEQRDFLRGYYEQVENLYEAVEHLALAQFRGFGICERQEWPESTRWEPIDGWNLVQDGLRPRWRYNPLAAAGGYDSLGEDADLPMDRLVAHACPRPIHEVALQLFVRAGLSERDWDAWCDIYGMPGGVVTGPPDVPEPEAAAYEAAAEQIAQGGSGYLPHGSDYTPNGHPTGTAPYEQRLRWLTEQLILAGTGGQLTMLASPTGIGQGASGEHADTFRTIARGDARRISETIQRQVDRQLLAKAFPGQPVLAYWQLCLHEEVDGAAVVDQAVKLSQAGYRIRLEQLAERTGYEIEPAAPAAAPTPPEAPAEAGDDEPDRPAKDPETPPEPEVAGNRAISGAPRGVATDTLANQNTPPRKTAGSTSGAAGAALAADLAPLRGRMAVVLRLLGDPEADLQTALEEGLRILDEAGPDVLRGDALARELEAALQQAVIQGAAGAREGKGS